MKVSKLEAAIPDGELCSLIANELSDNPMHALSAYGAILRDARLRAGLTQRELARRAGTSQSVIARIEQGRSDPSTATLARLLGAAGFEFRTDLTPIAVAGSHMLDDVARILSLTPEERFLEVRNVSRFEAAARLDRALDPERLREG